MAGSLERGDVCLCAFPQPDKPRPVLVLTRSSAIRYLARVTVAPITSSIRDVPSEVRLDVEDGMRQPCVVNLHNLVTVSKTRLGPRLARLGVIKMESVCNAMDFALGCEKRKA